MGMGIRFKLDGSGKFGKHAQRHMVVEAMQGALTSNDGIRSEAVYFNLIASSDIQK